MTTAAHLLTTAAMRNELDITWLVSLVKARRGALSLRDAAAQIEAQGGDISPSTLSRVENGKDPDFLTFLMLCDWLNVPAASLFVSEPGKGEDLGTLPDRVGGLLYAEPGFDPEAAALIVGMVAKLTAVKR